MSGLIESGRIADIVLAVLAVEFVALVLLAKNRAQAARDAIFALGPGACLVLALRAALTDAPWPEVALWLAASLPLHLTDLLRRRKN